MSRVHSTLLIRLILIAALAFGALATVSSYSSTTPVAAKEGKDKGGEKGKGGEKKHKSNKGHGESDKHEKKHDIKGKGNKRNPIEVETVVAYTIDVQCDSTDGGTTCRFTPHEPAGAHTVTHMVIGAEAICAPVIGGDAQLLDPDPVTGVSGYTTSGSESEINLVLDSEVSPGGQSTYWVKVTGAVLPASGPGLQCVQAQEQVAPPPTSQPTTDAQPTLPLVTPTPVTPTAEPTTEVTDSTGSIVVEAYDCPIATAEADYDWFGECERSGEGLRFRLIPAGVDAPTSTRAVTDAGGQARFSQLEPGLYVLTQMERDWCHANSDGVDDSGNVIVTAGRRTTVWIFACAEITADQVDGS